MTNAACATAINNLLMAAPKTFSAYDVSYHFTTVYPSVTD